MNEITKRLLIIVVAICFLSVAALYRNIGRFQPIADNLRIAIDTHTSRVCTTEPAPSENACAAFAKDWK